MLGRNSLKGTCLRGMPDKVKKFFYEKACVRCKFYVWELRKRSKVAPSQGEYSRSSREGVNVGIRVTLKKILRNFPLNGL